MADTKLDSQVKSASEGDVSAGEIVGLSQDEQYLANLGYKQGERRSSRSWHGELTS